MIWPSESRLYMVIDPLQFHLHRVVSRYHVREHGKCPKPGCKWEGARDDKHRTRHVWVNHSKWAKRVTFPSNGASCYLCGSLLKREDYVRRHIKEVHNGEKRKRKIGQRIAQELTS